MGKLDADAGLEFEPLLFELLPDLNLKDAVRVVSSGDSEMAYLAYVKQLIDSLLFVLCTAHKTPISP